MLLLKTSRLYNVSTYFHIVKEKPPLKHMKWYIHGDKALSSTQTFLWIQCFQEEEEDVEHDRNSGWQTTINSEMVGKVYNLLARDQRMTCRMKPSELYFSKELVWSVITKNSHKRQNCVKVWWLELQMTGCLHTHTTHPHPPDRNPLTGSKTLFCFSCWI